MDERYQKSGELAKKLQQAFECHADNPAEQYRILEIVTFNTHRLKPLGRACHALIGILDQGAEESGDFFLQEKCARLQNAYAPVNDFAKPDGWNDTLRPAILQNDESIERFLEFMINKELSFDYAVFETQLNRAYALNL